MSLLLPEGSTRVGYGWLDEHHPPDVAKVVAMHRGQGTKAAVLCVRGDDHVGGLKGYGGLTFYNNGPNESLKSLERVMHAWGYWLTLIQRDDVDLAELVFVNFKPFTCDHRPRPAGGIVEPPTLIHALRDFAAAVSGSIQPHPGSLWSAAEYVMLEFRRDPRPAVVPQCAANALPSLN